MTQNKLIMVLSSDFYIVIFNNDFRSSFFLSFFFLILVFLGKDLEKRGTGIDFLWNPVLNKASIDGSLMLR